MDKILEKAIATQEAELLGARKEGAYESHLSDARAALAIGISAEDVATITGLDAATVQQLAAESTAPK